MRNFLKTKKNTQKRPRKKELKKCWVIFPEKRKKFCELLVGYIRQTLEIQCESITYQNLERAELLTINKALAKSCILIIAYEGELTREVCYKIGLAQGCRRQVLLVRLRSSSENRNHKIPTFVKVDFSNFFVVCELDEVEKLELFFKEIISLLKCILEQNHSELLYKKAVKLCSSLEQDSGYLIEKIDKNSFLELISSRYQNRNLHYFGDTLWHDEKEDPYWQLILLIAKRPACVLKAFTLLKEKITKEPNSISTDGWLTINLITNQFGTGDNVAGNKIKNKQES